MVTANDVTIDGLTVQHVRSESHVGAVNLYYGARFTFRNGIVRDSSTVCLAMHAATGAKVLDSELTGCGKEGYFLNGMTNTTLARNRIHHNNMALAFDWGTEAGGGKTMASDNVTFDANEVAWNRGPGIWFDTKSHERDDHQQPRPRQRPRGHLLRDRQRRPDRRQRGLEPASASPPGDTAPASSCPRPTARPSRATRWPGTPAASA